MKLFQILRILGTATSVSPTIVSDPPGPASEHVRVVGLSLLGSGCPPGSTDVQVDATNTLMEITFSQYIVQTGPDISPADSRKNCNLKISMEFDAGFQFFAIDTKTAGFAQISAGSNGRCTSSFEFTGDMNMNLTGISGQASYAIELSGELEGPFDLAASPDLVSSSASPCGGSTATLSMDLECSVSPTESQVLIAVDRISGKIALRVALDWGNCP